jgi:hypothetical protein
LEKKDIEEMATATIPQALLKRPSIINDFTRV